MGCYYKIYEWIKRDQKLLNCYKKTYGIDASFPEGRSSADEEEEYEAIHTGDLFLSAFFVSKGSEQRPVLEHNDDPYTDDLNTTFSLLEDLRENLILSIVFNLDIGAEKNDVVGGDVDDERIQFFPFEIASIGELVD
jgi:hypothetical protein